MVLGNYGIHRYPKKDLFRLKNKPDEAFFGLVPKNSFTVEQQLLMWIGWRRRIVVAFLPLNGTQGRNSYVLLCTEGAHPIMCKRIAGV